MREKEFVLTLSALKDEVAERGDGWAVLVVRDDTPAAIIYLPFAADAPFTEVVAGIDLSDISWEPGTRETTQAYLGTVRYGVFSVRMELGAEDYRKAIYDDGEIVVEKVTDDLYLANYKDERKRYAFALNSGDNPEEWENVRWSVNFRRGAEIYTRYMCTSRGLTEYVELFDESGDTYCWLVGNGCRFAEKDCDVNTWVLAEVQVYDTTCEPEEEIVLRGYGVGYMRDYDERRPS